MKEKILNGITGIAFCMFLIFVSAIGDDGTTTAGAWVCLVGIIVCLGWIFLFQTANPDWGNDD